MKVRFTNGVQKGKVLEFPLSEITIGREDCNILRMTTGGVSRFHATLKQTPDRGWIIRDHDSTNGVKVNGKLINTVQTVFDGDTITIGEQEFVLEKLNPASPAVEFKPILTPAPAVSSEAAAAAPGTSVRVVEDEPEVDPGEKLAEDFRKQFISSGSSLFKKNPQSGSGAEKSADSSRSNKKRRSPLFNVIFYGALIFLVVAAVFTVNKKSRKKTEKSAAAAPAAAGEDLRASELKKFSLYFEKNSIAPEDNIMRRLEVRIENGKLHITLDDPPSQRKFENTLDMVKDHINEFEAFVQKLSSLKIFNAAERHSTGAVSGRMTVVSGGRMFSQSFSGNESSADYQNAEFELTYLLRGIGFISTVMSREEAEKEALDFFNNGESCRENYRGNPGNLREAVKYYRAAIRIYEQFSPPHRNLESARKQLASVQKLQRNEVRRLQDEYNRLFKLDDVPRMREVLFQLRDISVPESGVYREASAALQQLEQRRNSKRR